MRISVIAAVVVGCLMGVAAAQPAPDKGAAQTAYTEGQQRYAAGDYLAAAAKFESAYAFDRDPVYLFNIAQAYRLGNACAKAVTYYQKFLAEVPNPPNLTKVKLYLEQSEACAKAAAVVEPAPPPPAPEVAPPVIQAPVDAAPADPGRTKRWAGIGTVVVGFAAVGLGVYFTAQYDEINGEHREAMRECNAEMPCAAGYQKDYLERGQRAETRAWISFSVGGAAVIGGVALYMLGRNSSERPAVAIVPTTSGAMALGSLRF